MPAYHLAYPRLLGAIQHSVRGKSTAPGAARVPGQLRGRLSWPHGAVS